MVKKQTLLLVAGIVWAFAGINILRIGIVSCIQTSLTLIHFLLLLLVFVSFSAMFFRIVKKHKARILGYSEKFQHFLKFFNIQSYVLMFFMMGLGIGLRQFAKLPTIFFSVFYSGLGMALFLAGVLFVIEWINAKRSENSL